MDECYGGGDGGGYRNGDGKMAAARVDVDDEDGGLGDVLCCFRRWPIYRSWMGGSDGAAGSSYECANECVRSYGTPSCALAPLLRLPLDPLDLPFTPFHV